MALIFVRINIGRQGVVKRMKDEVERTVVVLFKLENKIACGYFLETYNQHDMEEAGINITFGQDNQSMSTKG